MILSLHDAQLAAMVSTKLTARKIGRRGLQRGVFQHFRSRRAGQLLRLLTCSPVPSEVKSPAALHA